MTRTETTTTKTDQHYFRRTLAMLVALAVVAALAMAFAGDAQAQNGRQLKKPPPQAPNTVIAFTSVRDGNQEIYTMAADGSKQKNLSNNPASDFDAAVS